MLAGSTTANMRSSFSKTNSIPEEVCAEEIPGAKKQVTKQIAARVVLIVLATILTNNSISAAKRRQNAAQGASPGLARRNANKPRWGEKKTDFG